MTPKPSTTRHLRHRSTRQQPVSEDTISADTISADTSGGNGNRTTTAPATVRVQILRPDGTSREVKASGFFREEYLCALLDEELCRLPSGQKLTVHLLHPDESLVRSLRDRWREGLSDNRRIRIREVLGPNDDPDELAIQLQRIEARLEQGERIHLALRSPRIARYASHRLRRILLQSQRGLVGRLRLSVYGTEEVQRAIMEHMEGMVRIQDYERVFGDLPWIDEPNSSSKQRRKRQRAGGRTSEQAVRDWIRRVERDRGESDNE